MVNKKPTVATLHQVALENLGNFKGDAAVAEDLGISTTPESFERRVASANQAARILSGANSIAELEPVLPPDNPKYGLNRQSWANQSPAQQAINQAGIAAVREALSHPKGQ